MRRVDGAFQSIEFSDQINYKLDDDDNRPRLIIASIGCGCCTEQRFASPEEVEAMARLLEAQAKQLRHMIDAYKKEWT